jgi:hypothetical protein
VKLVKEMVAGTLRIHQEFKLLAKPVDLFVGQHADASQIAILLEKTDLFIGQSKTIDRFVARERGDKIADRMVMN